MKLVHESALSVGQKAEILKLWNREYPENIIHKDITQLEDYFSGLNNIIHTLAVDSKNNILGWIIDFDRENEHWLAMLVDSGHQRKGIGSLLLDSTKQRNEELNAWVIDHDNYIKEDGSKYNSPLEFYTKNQFILLPGIRLEMDFLTAAKIRWRKRV